MRRGKEQQPLPVFAFGVCKVEAFYKKIAHRDCGKIADVEKESRRAVFRVMRNRLAMWLSSIARNGQIFDCVAV